ncbi:hypothetical protein D9757_012012 [Collybiopsis confluens]|uniref:Uncharacterized protein n=1 Tax=Collybiopsis confluens TaxID=2823264 RepID=A0A8H5GSM8_9AGAR|nr:hypothetical protein D9757_012012 [Collybiopsis confluens]
MALVPTSDTSEPLSQANLKDGMAGHLGGQTWQFSPELPLCKDSHSQMPTKFGKLRISSSDKHHQTASGRSPERNRGIIVVWRIFSTEPSIRLASEAMYRSLRFSVWDQPMQDGVDRAHPLKPDLAGALGIMEPMSLWWSPPLGEDGMKVPVELKKKSWRTCGAFPAWCNEGRVYLTKIHPSPFTIDRILHQTSCIRGRAPRVYHIRIPHPTSPEPLAGADVAVPDKYLKPESHLRRSLRLLEQKSRPRGSNPLPVPRQSRAGLVLGVKHGSEGGRVMKVLTEGLARMSLRIGRLKGKRSILREDDRSYSEIDLS